MMDGPLIFTIAPQQDVRLTHNLEVDFFLNYFLFYSDMEPFLGDDEELG